MGDIVEDNQMLNQDEHNQIISVGFLNSKSNINLLDNYKKAYDVVIVGDGSLQATNEIIRFITKEDKTKILGMQITKDKVVQINKED